MSFSCSKSVGNQGPNSCGIKRQASRRGKKSNSGFPNPKYFVRMANRFKTAAASKIREKTGHGGENEGPPNLASQMASALMGGTIAVVPTSDIYAAAGQTSNKN